MTDRKLKVAIAAGGTAGHVNPALALAEELRDRGHQVHFFGQTRRLEGKLVPQAGFPFTPVSVSGFDRSRPWTLATALSSVHREGVRLRKMFEDPGAFRPDVAIGFGAYLELPLIQAASKLSIPVALHEQNSVPGLANKQSARKAKLIAIAQPAVEEVFDGLRQPDARVLFTGNPVRRSVLAGDRERGRASLTVPQDATLLLVFGGSLGAHHLNDRLVQLKKRLLAVPNLYVVHSTGADDFESTVASLALSPEEQVRWRVQPYIENMGDMLAASDLVLSRSGASSVAEIAALAVPSVLVPYPHATADHQTTNARFLVDAGAAVLCPDAQIDDEQFAEELLSLLTDASRRDAMRAAASGLAQDKAAIRLADAIEGLVA